MRLQRSSDRRLRGTLSLSRPSSGFRIVPVLLLCFVAFTLPSGTAAQTPDGWIAVTEPGEWSASRRLSIPAGSQVRVVGQAYHSAGIRAITINGNAATLRPGAGGVVDFEGYVAAEVGTSAVSIELHPVTGESIVRMFPVSVSSPSGGDRARPAPVHTAGLSPGGAALRSLFVPGLGQLYTDRPLMSGLFFGAAAGAIAVGVLWKETTVHCLGPLSDGVCPPDLIGSEEDGRPYLIPAVGGAAAIAVVAAIDAYAAAKRLNRQVGSVAMMGEGSALRVGVSGHGLRLALQFRF